MGMPRRCACQAARVMLPAFSLPSEISTSRGTRSGRQAKLMASSMPASRSVARPGFAGGVLEMPAALLFFRRHIADRARKGKDANPVPAARSVRARRRIRRRASDPAAKRWRKYPPERPQPFLFREWSAWVRQAPGRWRGMRSVFRNRAQRCAACAAIRTTSSRAAGARKTSTQARSKVTRLSSKAGAV